MVACTGGRRGRRPSSRSASCADLSAQEANVDRGLAARALGAQVINIDGQDGGVHRGRRGRRPSGERSASSLT